MNKMNNGVSYTSTKPLEEFEINKKNKRYKVIVISGYSHGDKVIEELTEWFDTKEEVYNYIKPIKDDNPDYDILIIEDKTGY